MKPKFLSSQNPFRTAIFIAAASVTSAHAQTTLSVGDIQVVGVTGDANDSFSFVLWKDISSGTVVRFMDQSFTNATTGVLGTENDMSLTFTSAATAGSVIHVEDLVTTVFPSGVTATKSGSLSGISASGDQVFAYQGTAMGSGTDFTGRTLLYGFNIADTNWLSTGTATSNASYLPTAISAMDNNIDSGNFDNADYSGARTGLTTGLYRAAVGNIANFAQSDARFNLTTTQFAINSSASVNWDANGSTAGDGGAGTWDSATQSRFKNGAAGTTFIRWVNSTTGNDHAAVFGGTAGTVSVGASGVTASGLTFDVTGYTVQSNIVTLAGTTPTISVTTAAHSAIISSTLAGSNGLTKSGAGTLTLTVGNTYTGTTSVNSGTLALAINGNISTSVTTVNIGGTLIGTGTTGTVTVKSGGTLAPGNSPGILNAGNTILESGSTLSIEINGATLGTGYDQLNVVGSASLAGLLSITMGSFTPTDGSLFFILANDVTDQTSGTFSNASVNGNTYNLGGQDFQISYFGNHTGSGAGTFTGGNDVVLMAIPEPTSALLGGLGLLALLRRRR